MVGCVAAVISIGLLSGGSAAHGAASGQTGLRLVDPNSGKQLTGTLGSTQQFVLNLPSTAACSGPTSKIPSYAAFTYIVDNTKLSDPGNLTYGAGGPNNHGALPLILNDGSTPLEAVSTDEHGGLSGSAVVTSPLEFEPAFGPFGANAASGNNLYPGMFNMGISCANDTAGGTADRFWNIQVSFAASSSDPNHFTWQVVSTAKPTVTTLSASPKSPQPRGVGVTLSAAVTAAGAPVSTGQVQFFLNDTATPAPLGTTSVSRGVATFTVNALPLGTHILTAVFTPADPNVLSSSTSNAVHYVVTQAGGTTTTTAGSNTTTTLSGTTTTVAGSAGSTPTSGTGSGSGGSGGSSGDTPGNASPAASTQLAATGLPISRWVELALIAIVAGALLVEVGRGRLRPVSEGLPPGRNEGP
jgi:hypothetical protein